MSNQPLSTAAVSIQGAGHVVTVIIDRPPHNFLDEQVLQALAEQLEALDRQADCRAIVLAAQGRTFCAGADFSTASHARPPDPTALYAQAMRLFRTAKPIIAAVQGAAIGAGLGLALVADFRIASPQARFSANFNRLGFHPGFGLSHTLPRLIGLQQAARLFYTGARIDGARALEIGLVDQLVTPDHLLPQAQALACEIARSAPEAVQSTRQTLRQGLAEAVWAVNQRECALQQVQFGSDEFLEGVAAAAERRLPIFQHRCAGRSAS